MNEIDDEAHKWKIHEIINDCDEKHTHTHTQTRISRLVDDGSKLDKTKILMMATLILKTNLNSIR